MSSEGTRSVQRVLAKNMAIFSGMLDVINDNKHVLINRIHELIQSNAHMT